MKVSIERLLAAPAVMTVREARELVGVSETKAYKDIQEGRLEACQADPYMIRRDALMRYAGLSRSDVEGFRTPKITFPVTLSLDGVFLVVDDRGEPTELWVGEVGEGRLYELIEVV